MTYTKNTWANGDVITAAKLNNMEDGIANAGGGGGWPWFTVITQGFSNQAVFDSATFSYVKAVESGQYAGQLIMMGEKGSLLPLNIYAYGNETLYFTNPLPPANDIQLMFVVDEESTDVTCVFSGDIATTPVNVRTEPGGSTIYNGYAITGDCSITIQAN